MKGQMMFAILGQDERGLHWLANAVSVDEAREQIDVENAAFAGQEYDAILVVRVEETVTL